MVLRVEIVVRDEGGGGRYQHPLRRCACRGIQAKTQSRSPVLFVSVYAVGIGFHSISASIGQSKFSVKVMQPGYSTAGGS